MERSERKQWHSRPIAVFVLPEKVNDCKNAVDGGCGILTAEGCNCVFEMSEIVGDGHLVQEGRLGSIVVHEGFDDIDVFLREESGEVVTENRVYRLEGLEMGVSTKSIPRGISGILSSDEGFNALHGECRWCGVWITEMISL